MAAGDVVFPVAVLAIRRMITLGKYAAAALGWAGATSGGLRRTQNRFANEEISPQRQQLATFPAGGNGTEPI